MRTDARERDYDALPFWQHPASCVVTVSGRGRARSVDFRSEAGVWGAGRCGRRHGGRRSGAMAGGRVAKVVAGTAAGVLIPAALAGAGLAGSAQAQQAGARAAAPAVTAAAPGTITTVAGGPGGPGFARGVSVRACALKFAHGGLYIGSDVGGHAAVYRVSQSGGWQVPVGGSGAQVLPGLGGAADGVPASAVTLNGTCGVAADRAGNVLLADIQRVLVVAARSGRFYGTAMTAGRVYAVASGFNDAVDVELDAAGNLVVTNAGSMSSHTDPEIDSLVQVVAER